MAPASITWRLSSSTQVTEMCPSVWPGIATATMRPSSAAIVRKQSPKTEVAGSCGVADAPVSLFGQPIRTETPMSRPTIRGALLHTQAQYGAQLVAGGAVPTQGGVSMKTSTSMSGPT